MGVVGWIKGFFTTLSCVDPRACDWPLDEWRTLRHSTGAAGDPADDCELEFGKGFCEFVVFGSICRAGPAVDRNGEVEAVAFEVFGGSAVAAAGGRCLVLPDIIAN